MTVYYLETSALLKRYKSESGSEIVRSLFEEKQASETFVTSHLSILEVSSVAARLLKGRVIRQGDYRRMLGTFIQDLTTYEMVVMPVHNTLVSESIELVQRHPLRAADALQFGSALRVSQQVGDELFCVVSADKEIGEACLGYLMSLIDPEAPSALDQLRALRR